METLVVRGNLELASARSPEDHLKVRNLYAGLTEMQYYMWLLPLSVIQLFGLQKIQHRHESRKG